MKNMDRYPSDIELKTIAKWDSLDFKGLFKFVQSIWAEYGFIKIWGKKVTMVTGGWSGNESIIGAMQDNTVFWMTCWQSSKRGGQYIFQFPY